MASSIPRQIVALACASLLASTCSRAPARPRPENRARAALDSASSTPNGPASAATEAQSSTSQSAEAPSTARPLSERELSVPTQLPKAKSETDELAQSAAPAQAERLMGEYGFPAYPGMQHLCGKRGFLPGGGSMNYDVFTTPDPWRDVQALLGARLGKHGFVESAGFIGWRLPNTKAPTRELELVPKGRPSLADRCSTRPGADTETLLVARRW